VVERALAEMFGVLRLRFGEIEVELGNDECNGHILSIWHKRIWFATLYFLQWRTLSSSGCTWWSGEQCGFSRELDQIA
jgi:hypothetical protein